MVLLEVSLFFNSELYASSHCCLQANTNLLKDSSKPQQTPFIQLVRSIRSQVPPLRFKLWQLSLMLGYQTPSWTAGVGPLLSLALWACLPMGGNTKSNTLPVCQYHKLYLSRSLGCSNGMEIDSLYYQWCRIWSEWSTKGVRLTDIRVIEHSHANMIQLGPWDLLWGQWRAIPSHCKHEQTGVCLPSMAASDRMAADWCTGIPKGLYCRDHSVCALDYLHFWCLLPLQPGETEKKVSLLEFLFCLWGWFCLLTMLWYIRQQAHEAEMTENSLSDSPGITLLEIKPTKSWEEVKSRMSVT